MASTRRTTRATRAANDATNDAPTMDFQRTPERVARASDDVRLATTRDGVFVFARVFTAPGARGRSGSDARDAAATARSPACARDAIEILTMDTSRARLTQVSALLASPFLLFANALSPITPRAHRALDDAVLALADDDDDGGDDHGGAGRAPRMLDGDVHTPDGCRRPRGGLQGARTAPAMGCFNSPSRRARCVDGS